MTNEFKYDICVVGGAGHVGAPLAIVLAYHGFRVLIYDTNQAHLDQLAAGKMPFMEAGGEDLLGLVHQTGRLGWSTDPSALKGIRDAIFTIGTPVDEFHNPATHLLTDCIDQLLPYFADGACLILRSTLAPGTTDFLDRYLTRHRKHLLLAFCPERVVQGRAIEEIQTLAQIVSGTSTEAVARARSIFERIAPEIVELTTREAEYAKLICNAYRYIQFAATNQLYMMVESAGLDYNRLLGKMKQGYPRMGHIPTAGFTAGPCLMKDTMQLFAFQKHNFILGQVAMTINEGMPDYIVSQLAKSVEIKGCTIGILGMAFKAESDDVRDALSFKLKKILEFLGATVYCSDEYVENESFVTAEELLGCCEVVIIGVPHQAYTGLRPRPGQRVIDIWQSRETGRHE